MIIVVIYFIGFFLLLQLTVMMYLILRKRIKRYHMDRESKLKDKIFHEVQNYIQFGTPLRTRLLKAERYRVRIIEQLLNDFSELFADEETKTRVQRLAEENLSYEYLKMLQSKKWSDRMNTLYYIEDFRICSLKDEVWKRYLEKDELDIEKQQLARTLAVLQDRRLVDYLITTKEKWFLTLYKEVVRRLDERNFEYLLQHNLKLLCIDLQVAVLALIGEKQEISYLSKVEEELQNDHIEIRLQALKTICELEYITDVTKVEPFFRSHIWQERMLVAKVIRALQIERFKKELTVLIGDEYWWVRYAAAEAFSHFKDGQILLQYIQQKHEDRYARDMANQWLSTT